MTTQAAWGLDNAPIDCDALLRRCVGRHDLMERILHQFRDLIGQDVDLLLSAIERSECTEIPRLAHKLKGMASTVAACDLANIAAQIREAGLQFDHDQLSAKADELRNELSRLNAYFSRGMGKSTDE
jgi:HPt (histidine-containing phosphotransfer) domain-containing protein